MEKQLTYAVEGESQSIRQPVESSATMFEPVQPGQSDVMQIETLEKVWDL